MNIVLLWHMHQPYYVNPLTKTAMMPWVRLHAVKGYLDMIDLVARVPELQVNFNFTPVLVKQINELANGEVTDLWESWSRKPADALTLEEKKRILENFFKINWDTLVRPQPRYRELLDRRGHHWNERSLGDITQLFTNADYRDLQTLYNLSWCGYSAERRYPLLTELKKQGRDFTEEQKNAVLDIHREILKIVLTQYRDAVSRGQVEITTTPFFHPILPLVYDTDLAQRCMPGRTLPRRFSAPDDARAQLRLAQEQHEKVFGRRARGLWPSEGSVAPELVPLFAEAGIEYFCTDEGNLFRSLEQDPVWRNQPVDHLELFQGWRIHAEGAQVQALFRERPLSDFIGFNAARNEAKKSADYLLHHLEQIAAVVPAGRGCVCLALDGENAWEAFADGGEKFLSLFYEGLVSRREFRTRKLADYFTEFPSQAETSTLHTGSWISSDFDVWIGDPEENKGWEWIAQTRAFLVETLAAEAVAPETASAAWWEIYASEGSDWFWWYGPDFTTDCDFLFDELFRTHLQNVYKLLGKQYPAHLDIPICLPSEAITYILPHRYLTPPLTGKLGNFYDWVGAGYLNIRQQQTAMFQADRIGEELYFAFDQDRFYLRLDLRQRPAEVVIQLTEPVASRILIRSAGGRKWDAQVEQSDDQVNFKPVTTVVTVAWEKFLIVGIPRESLRWSGTGRVSFFVQILERGLLRERYPERGALEFPVPREDFERAQWFI